MIVVRVTGNKMTIEADLTAGTLSSTGKSMNVASTNGFMAVDGTEFKVNLNVIKPRR